ncbi:MAG: D-alanyl-D-alanine carboxypeptidase [Erythrobacter sp.]|nr:MAG: D-alanyl-D-alanine carboxypeptidase [Erythrobacter sp.]
MAVAALAIAAPASSLAAPVPQDIPVALLVDITSGQVLYAREAQRRFMPASVTKVMTAYTAFRLVDAGDLRLDMPYLYSQALEDQWYNEGSTMFLRAGERPTVAQLLLGITTVSGNDASAALAEAATGSQAEWLELMNANARDLGMYDTHFGSPNGFPDGGQTYTTAQDLVLLAEALTEHYAALYRRFFGRRALAWGGYTQQNHDPVTGRVAGADGIKTGYTNEAGFTFLGSAERDGRRLAMVLAGAPSGSMRDAAARAMLEWGFAGFARQTLLERGTLVGTARVQDGADSEVGLRLAEDFTVALPPGAGADRWQVDLVYSGPIEAPIAAGDPVARLRLTLDGEVVLETPLEAAMDVPRANPFQRVGNAFRTWLS